MTYESGRVVVSDGLGITIGLQRRVGLDNLFLQGSSIFTLRSLRLSGLWER